jgi:AmiR/NasT family two-component response regulator
MVQAHEDDTEIARNLEAALLTREIIGQAQGILMERERITADQAFVILRRASQHLNIKLHDVAQALVEPGSDPILFRGVEPAQLSLHSTN